MSCQRQYQLLEVALTAALLAGSAAALWPTPAAAQDEIEQLDADTEDLTETIPPSEESGESVELIEPQSADTDGSELKTASAASNADSNSRAQVSGYARQSLELVYGELVRKGRRAATLGPTCEADPTPCLWRDTFISRTQLVLRGSYLAGRHFEATVSGMLGYTLHAAENAPQYSVGIVDLARGELDTQLREAYVGFFWPAVDLRIGQQRVAWGRADFQSPNDVINARDLRDPFLSENELRYLPTPVIRASLSGGVFTLEGVLSPFFVPDRFDLYGTNWSVVQRHAPSRYQEFLGAASLLVDSSVERQLPGVLQQSERPLDNGKGASGGLRAAAALPGVDLSAYYHYGYDSTPFVALHPAFFQYLGETTFLPGDATAFRRMLELSNELGVGSVISARYVRRHHAGFDLATTLGPLGLRLDTAYQTRRVFYQADFNSFASPTLLGVAAIEYQTGSLDEVVLLEFLASHQLEQRPAGALPLLGYERTTAGIAGTLRWPLSESWGLDLRGLVGLNPKTYVLLPALRYKANDSFSLRLGALVMSGEESSFGWYYGDNDTAFVQLRYAF